ncbi:MAG: hypothetical protein AABW79_01630 [Nanoarchaeota archaeon]
MTQLQKDYANDPAKAKARDLLRGMVDRTLLRFQKPSDLYVLCFPGIDAAEIHQVYDPLSIPRENITGIERDPRVAQALEDKKLGIRIVNKSIENFVKEQDSFSFDVNSLDYCGPINQEQIGSLGKLLRKNENDEIIVHQANLAKRDANRASLYAFNLLTSDEERDMTKIAKSLEKENSARKSGFGIPMVQNLGGLDTILLNINEFYTHNGYTTRPELNDRKVSPTGNWRQINYERDGRITKLILTEVMATKNPKVEVTIE